MALAEEFEDLVAWQKARELNRAVYAITRQGEFARDFALRDQIRRAAISVMSNIAEGFDRRSRAEFKQFLGIAKASCAEVRAQLYIALDAGYVDRDEFARFKHQAMEVSRVIGGLMSSLS
ncbi:four helix bundle protein [Algisphaera agarilytica]|uniref:Four helix bundle protein n=1 Tax=Algisphaera agarilytica TaxID=1385975 RepID=A0A7X0H9H5_9BACT|nr:four helix bundle protein [Algisphaera agarilytica]MBB6431681.1 four helix bundle protein [Algisphaera agarilytica]